MKDDKMVEKIYNKSIDECESEETRDWVFFAIKLAIQAGREAERGEVILRQAKKQREAFSSGKNIGKQEMIEAVEETLEKSTKTFPASELMEAFGDNKTGYVILKKDWQALKRTR
jgi:hypothetical protein